MFNQFKLKPSIALLSGVLFAVSVYVEKGCTAESKIPLAPVMTFKDFKGFQGFPKDNKIDLRGILNPDLKDILKGTKDGGGGYVVQINGQYKLLDFVEGGIEESPYNPNVNVDPSIAAYLQKNIGGPRADVIERLANKFTLLARTNPGMAFVLIKSAEMYDWKFVNAPIVRLNDIGRSNIDLRQLEIYQAAVRTNIAITVTRKVFDSMDVENAAGLLMHEMVYVLTSPGVFAISDPSTGAPKSYTAQTENYLARIITQTLYKQANSYSRGSYAEAIFGSLRDYRSTQPKGLAYESQFVPLSFDNSEDYLFIETWEDGEFLTLVELKHITPSMSKGISIENLRDENFVKQICKDTYSNFSTSNSAAPSEKSEIIRLRSLLTKVDWVGYCTHYRSDLGCNVGANADIRYLRTEFSKEIVNPTIVAPYEKRLVNTPEKCEAYLKGLKPYTNPFQFLR